MTNDTDHPPYPPAPHASDPLRGLRRGGRVLWLATVPAILVGGLWALGPIERHKPTELPSRAELSSPASSDGEAAPPAIDVEAFAVNLWNPVSAPSPTLAEAAPPSPAKPLNVQLIGIITEDGVAKAALYDVDSDRLLIIADGETIGDRTVRIVRGPGGARGGVGGATGIEISDGSSKQVLLLRAEKGNS